MFPDRYPRKVVVTLSGVWGMDFGKLSKGNLRERCEDIQKMETSSGV
jgi:hypothetical protein